MIYLFGAGPIEMCLPATDDRKHDVDRGERHDRRLPQQTAQGTYFYWVTVPLPLFA